MCFLLAQEIGGETITTTLISQEIYRHEVQPEWVSPSIVSKHSLKKAYVDKV